MPPYRKGASRYMPAMPTERFSNSRSDFENEIVQELTAAITGSPEYKVKAVYIEFDAFPINRYAIIYAVGSTNQLTIRKWHSAFDNERFSLGIYNLDRIAIEEIKVELTDEQSSRLDKMLETEPVIQPLKL